MRRFKTLILAAGALLLCAEVVRAQAAVSTFNRQIQQIQRDTILRIDDQLSLDQRALFDYGGYFTYGYLDAQDNNNENHILNQYDLLGYVRMNIDGAHEFFLRGFTQWQDFNTGDSFNGDGDQHLCEADRWFYRFDLARYESAYYGKQIDYNITAQIGRDLFIWGNGLVLSTDLMAANTVFSWSGNELNLLAGLTPSNTVDFDVSRPAFDHDTNRGFYGGSITRDVSGQKPYIYGLMQEDYNNDDDIVFGPVTTDFKYNSYYIGIGSTGPIGDRLIYGIEAVYEGGQALSNSGTVQNGGLVQLPQTEEDIMAWALDGRIDYLFPDQRKSRIGAEVILASGDSDRDTSSTNTFGGNKSGTDDNAFNAFGLLNTGLAFAPAVSNLALYRVGASTFPMADHSALKRLQVGTDVFLYYKMDADAPIDEPSSNVSYLGWEPDVYLNWQMTSDVTLVFRYGIFFPNDGALTSNEPRQYIYGGVTYAF